MEGDLIGAHDEENNSILELPDGATLFYFAAENGYEAVVSALLPAGADKNASNTNGATPLFVASEKGHAAVVSALLAAGADKKASNANGATPLFVASENGHEAVVSALLAVGAEKNEADLGRLIRYTLSRRLYRTNGNIFHCNLPW